MNLSAILIFLIKMMRIYLTIYQKQNSSNFIHKYLQPSSSQLGAIPYLWYPFQIDKNKKKVMLSGVALLALRRHFRPKKLNDFMQISLFAKKEKKTSPNHRHKYVREYVNRTLVAVSTLKMVLLTFAPYLWKLA